MTDARTEIWESFIGLLRAYSAGVAVVTRGAGLVTVRQGEMSLEFGFDAASGDGVWRIVGFRDGLQGRFHMLEDGSLELGVEVKALDIAAIDFLLKLSESERNCRSLGFARDDKGLGSCGL